MYTELTVLLDYIISQGVDNLLDELSQTIKHNATRFSNTQIILDIVMASMPDAHRMSHIQNFTCDTLEQHQLGLHKEINNGTYSGRLKDLGRTGTFTLYESPLRTLAKMLKKSNLLHMIIDCDSTGFTVYGNQKGSGKGYYP